MQKVNLQVSTWFPPLQVTLLNFTPKQFKLQTPAQARSSLEISLSMLAYWNWAPAEVNLCCPEVLCLARDPISISHGGNLISATCAKSDTQQPFLEAGYRAVGLCDQGEACTHAEPCLQPQSKRNKHKENRSKTDGKQKRPPASQEMRCTTRRPPSSSPPN